MKTKSVSWDWESARSEYWEEPSNEILGIMFKWRKQEFLKVLDLGAGLGCHTFPFALNGFEVTAFDLSRQSIEHINRKAKEKQLNIQAVEGDMLLLPFDDSSFDSLIAYHSIYHADYDGLKQILKEIYRVLREDGSAYITLNSKRSHSWISTAKLRIGKNTMVKANGHEAGIPHTYLEHDEVIDILSLFNLKSLKLIEDYHEGKIGAHFHIEVTK